MTELTTADESLRSKKTLTWIAYGLYAASFLVGITSIVAIILNYVKRGDMAGTFLESHFNDRLVLVQLDRSDHQPIDHPHHVGDQHQPADQHQHQDDADDRDDQADPEGADLIGRASCRERVSKQV